MEVAGAVMLSSVEVAMLSEEVTKLPGYRYVVQTFP